MPRRQAQHRSRTAEDEDGRYIHPTWEAFRSFANAAGVSPARALQLLVWDFVTSEGGVLERVEFLEQLAASQFSDLPMVVEPNESPRCDSNASVLEAAAWANLARAKLREPCREPFGARDDLKRHARAKRRRPRDEQ